MSEQPFSLVEDNQPLTPEQREELDHTIYQALHIVGEDVDNTGRITQEICNRFAVPSLDVLPASKLAEAHAWVLMAWTAEHVEWHAQSIYDRVAELLREQQSLYLQLNRLNTLIATKAKSLVSLLVLVVLIMPPAMAARLQQSPVVFPPINVDPQTLYNALAQAPKVSGFVDAQFVFDCVKGFPETFWSDAYLGPGAAGVATEIAATAYSPKLYVLQSGNLIMTYFGDWTGPKVMQRLTGFLDRVPPRDPGEAALKIVWQNVYPATVAQQNGRGRDPRDQDQCQACMRAVVTVAHKKKLAYEAAAVVAAGLATAACTGLSGGILIGICIALAASALALAYRQAEIDYQDRILSAKNDECAVDRRTGKSCEWER